MGFFHISPHIWPAQIHIRPEPAISARVLNWQGVPIVLLTKSMKMCYLDGSFLLSLGNPMSPNHVMYMCMVAQFCHWRYQYMCALLFKSVL